MNTPEELQLIQSTIEEWEASSKTSDDARKLKTIDEQLAGDTTDEYEKCLNEAAKVLLDEHIASGQLDYAVLEDLSAYESCCYVIFDLLYPQFIKDKSNEPVGDALCKAARWCADVIYEATEDENSEEYLKYYNVYEELVILESQKAIPEIQPGTYFEDCAYNAEFCLVRDDRMGDIWGISLQKWFEATGKVDGFHVPDLTMTEHEVRDALPDLEKSCIGIHCSLYHCGPTPLLKEEAELMARETNEECYQRARRRGMQIDEYAPGQPFHQSWMDEEEPYDLFDFGEKDEGE